jgi:hypothetical protein
MNDDEDELFNAIDMQNLRKIQFLVENRNVNININFEGRCTPLVIAVYTGNLSIVKYLVEHGALIKGEEFGAIPTIMQLITFLDKMDKQLENFTIYAYLVEKKIIVMDPVFKALNLAGHTGSGSYPLFSDWDQKGAIATSRGGKDLAGGYLYDPVNLDDYTNKEYLDESPGNLIFMIKTGDGFKAVGYEAQNLVRKPETDLYLDCDRDNRGKYYVSGGGDGRIRQENNEVTLDGPFYAKIVFEEGLIIYVILNNLIGCLESGQRVFLAENSGLKLDYTVSYGFAKKLRDRDYDNIDALDRELDLGIAVGADHCQAGTSKTLYDLYICEGRDCL